MRLSIRLTGVCIVLALLAQACASAEASSSSGLVVQNAPKPEAPCWIDRPDCLAVAGESALYFVGQSESPLAHPGQPARESVHAARRDAELAYARFLAVDIETSSTLRTVFTNDSYRLQFDENIKEQVSQTVGALRKAAQYNVSHDVSPDGVPKWSVFVLLKVFEEDVAKHRLAIAAEKERLENLPPSQDEWVVSLFNIDDSVSVYVNDLKINQCDLSRSCKVKLSPHFRPGSNQVRLVYRNEALFWTYGYEVFKNEELMYKGRCGQVWVFGCGFLNMNVGDVHQFDFEVEWTQ